MNAITIDGKGFFVHQQKGKPAIISNTSVDVVLRTLDQVHQDREQIAELGLLESLSPYVIAKNGLHIVVGDGWYLGIDLKAPQSPQLDTEQDAHRASHLERLASKEATMVRVSTNIHMGKVQRLPKKKNRKHQMSEKGGEFSSKDLIFTSESRERLNYLDTVNAGKVHVTNALGFTEPTTVHIDKSGRWYITDISEKLLQVDPKSFDMVPMINIVARRNFSGGDYLIRTSHNRIFEGRDWVINYELDPQTLARYENVTIQLSSVMKPSAISGCYPGKGKQGRNYEKEPKARKIILHRADDVCAAMIDIADGHANPGDYEAINGTRKLLPELERIQRIRDNISPEVALRAATDYMIKNMEIPQNYMMERQDGITSRNGARSQMFNYRRVNHRNQETYDFPVSNQEPDIVQGRGQVRDKPTRQLPLPANILGAIAVFSCSGQYR